MGARHCVEADIRPGERVRIFSGSVVQLAVVDAAPECPIFLFGQNNVGRPGAASRFYNALSLHVSDVFVDCLQVCGRVTPERLAHWLVVTSINAVCDDISPPKIPLVLRENIGIVVQERSQLITEVYKDRIVDTCQHISDNFEVGLPSVSGWCCCCFPHRHEWLKVTEKRTFADDNRGLVVFKTLTGTSSTLSGTIVRATSKPSFTLVDSVPHTFCCFRGTKSKLS